MKRILCVAVLMGLTTALHAVTYTWDSNTGSFKNGTDTLGKYKDISKLVITVTYAGTTTSFKHDYFALQQKGSENSTTDILKMTVTSVNDSTGKAVHSINGGGYTGQGHWSAARAGSVDTPITSTYTFGSVENGIFKTFNVKHVFTNATQYDPNSGNFNGSFDFNGKSFDQLVAFDGTTINSAKIEIEGTPVPEPGLLALLALGGAGLVLRRKVRA